MVVEKDKCHSSRVFWKTWAREKAHEFLNCFPQHVDNKKRFAIPSLTHPIWMFQEVRINGLELITYSSMEYIEVSTCRYSPFTNFLGHPRTETDTSNYPPWNWPHLRPWKKKEPKKNNRKGSYSNHPFLGAKDRGYVSFRYDKADQQYSDLQKTWPQRSQQIDDQTWRGGRPTKHQQGVAATMIHLKINPCKKEVPFGNPPFSRVPMLNFGCVRFSFFEERSLYTPKKHRHRSMYLCLTCFLIPLNWPEDTPNSILPSIGKLLRSKTSSWNFNWYWWIVPQIPTIRSQQGVFNEELQ